MMDEERYRYGEWKSSRKSRCHPVSTESSIAATAISSSTLTSSRIRTATSFTSGKAEIRL